MKPELFFCKHSSCKSCTEIAPRIFRYVETKKDEKRIFTMEDNYTLIFILSGEVRASCNEFVNVRFQTGEIMLCPMNSSCIWETIDDVKSIILKGKPELPPCDEKSLRERADLWLNAVSTFQPLPIRSRLTHFLETVRMYLDDGITCPYLHKSKMLELSMIFRAYYSPEELISFFFPAVRYTHEFELFVMNNYLKMKGVKEFVDLSGMNLSTFNRKFKTHFNQSPYQWLIKQKSKHMYHELSTTNKSLATIARDFHFADASHFNRYCKAMFGASPSKIRENILNGKRA